MNACKDGIENFAAGNVEDEKHREAPLGAPALLVAKDPPKTIHWGGRNGRKSFRYACSTAAAVYTKLGLCWPAKRRNRGEQKLAGQAV